MMASVAKLPCRLLGILGLFYFSMTGLHSLIPSSPYYVAPNISHVIFISRENTAIPGHHSLMDFFAGIIRSYQCGIFNSRTALIDMSPTFHANPIRVDHIYADTLEVNRFHMRIAYRMTISLHYSSSDGGIIAVVTEGSLASPP